MSALLNIAVVIVGFYCMLESISAAAEMNKGDRLCRLAKFLLTGVSGLYAVRHGLFGQADFGMLLLSTSIALCIWPRMVFRLVGGQRTSDKLRAFK